jgi:hypothetical protein
MKLLACVLSLVAAVLLAAVAPAGGPPGKATDKTKQPPPASGPAKEDKNALPPGVLVPYEMLKGAPHPLPVYWVPADIYRKMQEQIKELKRQLQPDSITSICKLNGRVAGDFVTLQAELIIVAERAPVQVAVGFGDAVISGDPELDGELPVLTGGADEGYVVRIAKAGRHRLLLPLKLPITPQRQEGAGGNERGFEMQLPGAAVTNLTLELPPAVKEVHWNGLVQKAAPGRPGAWDIALGRAQKLKLSWREPAPGQGNGPLLIGRWQTTVTIQENQVLTEARLNVEDRRQGNREWRIWAPPGATLKVVAPETGPYEVSPAGKEGTLLVKGPSSDHLVLQVSIQQPLSSKPLPVGPFLLVGAGQQEGTIEVQAAPQALRGFRLVYHRHSKVEQQDVPKDRAAAEVQARFRYREGPLTIRPGAPPRPLLEMELKPVVALVEAAVQHRLHLSRAEAGWKVVAQTRIQATPLHNGADFIEVLLPQPRPATLPATALTAVPAAGLAPWLVNVAVPLGLDQLWPISVPASYQCELPADAKLEMQPGRAKARVQLPKPELERFTVVLKETYLLPADLSAVRLQLPRPLTALDRGGEVHIETEDNQQIVPPGEAAEFSADPHHWIRTFASAPAYVDLAWKPYRPEVTVTITADVMLERHSAHVRQELRLPAKSNEAGKGQPSRVVELSVPAGVSLLKKIEASGQAVLLHRTEQAAGKARAEVTGDLLLLEYDFPLPAQPDKVGRGPAMRSFPVPLVWPTDATRAQTKVRIWCESGALPQLPDAPLPGEVWKERRPEKVAGHDSFPALVVEGEGNELPLTLTLQGSPLPPLKSVVADRVLVQVLVDEEGNKRCRARFLLSRLDTDHLDIEFPAPLERLSRLPEARLDGTRLPLTLLAAGSRTARYRIQREQGSRPVLLDISYQLEAGSPQLDGLFRTALYPPVLHGDVFIGQVRWQVGLPPSWVALPPSGASASPAHWRWRNWLLTPAPTLSESDLEAWLIGEAALQKSKSESRNPKVEGAGLVFGSADLGPVGVLHFPRLLWLSVCSTVLLLLGVLLLAAPLSRLIFGLSVGFLGVVVLAAALMWPAVFPALAYGAEPGAAVLLLVVGVQWFLQHRYRRQVVFMPGFTRARPGSSLSRRSSSQRPHDKSTVDAPAAAVPAPAKEVGT